VGALMKPAVRLGIDFDNTLVTYDEVFRATAASWGQIGMGMSARKQAIRDHLRRLPDGELTWQRLQGHVYGKGIAEAKMFAGVDSFLRRCREQECPVLIVSHKTEFGHHDPDRVNLRQAALDWMSAQGFFRDSGYGIPVENVYFEGTRAEKLARIGALGCSHFIDDLEEVLTDPQFPPAVSRILFSDGRDAPVCASYIVCPSWSQIEEHIFRVDK
jgi:hypothetical protein